MPLQDSISQVHFVTVDVHHVSQRIDNFLISYLQNVPKSKIYRIIRKGEVRVNKKRVKPEYRLQLEDRVRVPPLIRSEKPEVINPSQDALDSIKQAIIFQSEELICLNKPSGLPVHGGTGIKGGAINILRLALPELKFIELIHRLDRETSGCLLIAKSGRVLKSYQQLWQQNRVEKYYYCLVSGHWPKALQKVDAPLLKNTLQSGERMVRIDKEGKASITYFKPLEYFADSTLLEVRLGTGRTHQIRVHAAYAGHPIAGDLKYGDRYFNSTLKSIGLTRLFLHAFKLVLPDAAGQLFELTAPLPKELSDIIKTIQGA